MKTRACVLFLRRQFVASAGERAHCTFNLKLTSRWLDMPNVTRRFFLAGITALSVTGVPRLPLPRIDGGLAFAIGNEYYGHQVYWAKTLEDAWHQHSGAECDYCGNCDDCESTEITREPIFDGYAETGIPLHGYHKAGWRMPCVRCEPSMCEEYPDDWYPMPTRDGGFEVVCYECMTIREHLDHKLIDRETAEQYDVRYWSEPWGEITWRHTWGDLSKKFQAA